MDNCALFLPAQQLVVHFPGNGNICLSFSRFFIGKKKPREMKDEERELIAKKRKRAAREGTCFSPHPPQAVPLPRTEEGLERKIFMAILSDKSITKLSRCLRKNMTPEEKHLWYDFFKNLDVTVRRQYPIQRYIADFYVPSAKLVVELDGSQHFEPENTEQDKYRTEVIETLGLKVIRFSNLDIKHNFNAVCEEILKYLE